MHATRSLRRAIPLGMRTVGWVTDRPGAGFKLRSLWLDEVRDDEILIEMKYSGICHTDVVVSQGMLDGMVEFPAILGHEGGGKVMALGEKVKNKSLEVGDSVVLSYNTCKTCPACVAGQRAFCHSHPQVNHNAVRLTDRTSPARLHNGTPVRSQYFGQSSFAKHSVIHEDTVVKCNSPEKLEIYTPLGCGFQTGAGAVFNIVNPKFDESVVIFGMGTVGLAALMACRYLGVQRLIAVDLHNGRLDLATQLGATDTIDASKIQDVPSAIQALTGGGADQAIECTGAVKVIENCLRAVAAQGRVVALGVPKPGSKVSIDALDFLLANKTFKGIIQGGAEPYNFLPFLMDLHRRGHFPVEKICDTFCALDIDRAIKLMQSGEVIKPVISWENVGIDSGI